MGVAPCIARDRDDSSSGLIPCTHSGRKDEDADKQLLESLKTQVEQLHRRNTALEQAVASTPRSGQGLHGLREAAASGSPRLVGHLEVGGGLPAGAGGGGATLDLSGGAGGGAASARAAARRRPATGVGASAAERGSLSKLERSRLLQQAAQAAAEAVPLPVGLLFPNKTTDLLGALSKVGESSPPLVHELLQKASALLGRDVLRLCAEGPAAELDTPSLGHPLVYISSCIAVECLRSESPETVNRCQAVAGVGVGEFAALYAACALDFEVGLRLVILRAEEMERVSKSAGESLQLTVMGMTLERIRHLCDQVLLSCGAGEVCSVAYSVVPKAHICAGTRAAVELLHSLVESQNNIEARASLKDAQQGARYGAFQTKLMEEAKQALKKVLYSALPDLKPPRCAVYFNVMGEALPAGAQPSLIVELLSEQLTSTVLWEQTLRTMLREGVDRLAILGPKGGAQLQDSIRQINTEAAARTRLYSV